VSLERRTGTVESVPDEGTVTEDSPRPTDGQVLEAAFQLTGAKGLHVRHEEEGRSLDAYRCELEAALDHPANAADLAVIDSARRARGMIFLLTRKCLNRGIATRRGEVRGWVAELRAWMRLEADLLARLAFRAEPKPVQDLRALWNFRAEKRSGSGDPPRDDPRAPEPTDLARAPQPANGAAVSGGGRGGTNSYGDTPDS